MKFGYPEFLTGLVRQLAHGAVLAALLSCLLSEGFAAEDREVEFRIHKQRADTALMEFAHQAGLAVLFPYDSVSRRKANKLSGTYRVRDGLNILLEGTGLDASLDPGDRLTIRVLKSEEQEDVNNRPKSFKSVLAAVAATLSLSAVNEAAAQSAPSNPAPEEIVVTGSRIVKDGYQAPTPVLVATAENLRLSSPTSLSDGLAKLPAFVGSDGPNRSNNIFATPTHGNVLALRGLGENRTLVLFDGQRVPPTSYTNTVDVDILPQLLVQRVEVVTGGASASYGSDAVSGVVNYVLDTGFRGMKGEVQSGASLAKAQNDRAGLAFGADIGERGHLLVSGEYYHNDGYLQQDRPELADFGLAVGSVVGGAAPGSAANPYINVPNVRVRFATEGGVALTGPFTNMNFVSAGIYRPAVDGAATGTGNVFKAPSDWMAQPGTTTAAAELRNTNLFGRYTYDFSDRLKAYAQVLGGESTINYNTLPNLEAFPGPSIFSGNAFLPAPLQSQLTTANAPSFVVAKLLTELGPIRSHEVVTQHDFALGVSGLVGRFDWRVDYVHGESEHGFSQPNQLSLPEFYAAIDAVVDPSTGGIVCRPTLDANPIIAARYANCQPFDLLGYGASSPAARQYVLGTSRYNAQNTTSDLSANVTANLATLAGGPMSIAFGANYRSADLAMTSNGDPANRPDFTGLRGVFIPSQFYLTNQGVGAGSEHVTELYGELDIPVAKSLSLDAAVRGTDYSTTGSSTTWKFGVVWKPVESLTFRASRSRDIRAPTLFDLFAGSLTTQAAALDPHTGVNAGFESVRRGNLNLKPEQGDTVAAGFVFRPKSLKGLALSLDYYNIEIQGAVATLTTLALLQDCEASNGTAPSCASIVRPFPFSDHSPANIPISVSLSGINVAQIKTHGFDLDVTYSKDLGAGTLGLRAYVTSVGEFATRLTSQQPLVDYAGYNAAGSGGVAGAVPDLKGSVGLNYVRKKFGVYAQENIIGALKLGPTLRYVDPNVPSFNTTDLTLTYRPGAEGNKGIDLFLNITNLTDRTAPIVYGTSTPGLSLSTIVGLYDSTGRAFVAGARFRF